MRLVRIGAPGAERPAVLLSDTTALDVGDLLRDFDGAFFASGGLDLLARIVAEGSGREVDISAQRLGAPIARPGMVLCVGLNYADHVRESGMEAPAEPVLFNKAPNTVVGPNDPIVIPRGGDRTDWEVELGVVIGRPARYLESPEAALSCIAGFVLSNDVSERSFQLERGGQWVKGKSAETFNPLGPWMATTDSIDDFQNLGMSLSVNGEVMQHGSTSDMIFGVLHLVWYASQFMVLEPGDLVNTGTPAGVGAGFAPPRFLRPGDSVEASIEGLGRQQQTCVVCD